MSKVTTHDEPHDRLTRMCQSGITAIEADPEFTEGIKGVIMLDDGKHGGIAITGYQEGGGREAFVDMLVHLQAIAESNGLRLDFIGIPDTVEGAEDG